MGTLVVAALVLSSCRLGAGSVAEGIPAGFPAPSDRTGAPVAPLVTDALAGPVPTNDWWSSLAYPYQGDRHSENLYPHPLTARARSDGLELGHPTEATVATDGSAYWFAHQRDLTLGVDGLDAPATEVAGFGDWTVTAAWDDGTRDLAVTLGHGLPYAYADAGGGAVTVDLVAPATTWVDDGSARAITVGGHSWGLFAPSGSTWVADSPTSLRVDPPGAGYASVAALPDEDPATFELYRRHAYAFVTGTRVGWAVDEATGSVRTTFDLTTAAREGTETTPLVALYPHQWQHTPQPLLPLAYASPRGEMRVAATTSFTTTTPYDPVLPALPAVDGVDREELAALVDEALAAPDLVPGVDTYGVGKDLGRLAELVPIADQVGDVTARDRLLATMEAELEDWFTYDPGEPGRFFAHEPTWGTLIGYPSAYGSATELNDHHFHWGYFVRAAAVVAWYDPAWAAGDAWGPMVRELIRDVAGTDRASARYPFLRTFDPYAGHSWASGHSAFGAGANQESSSEALAFASGVQLWGQVTGDAALADLGTFLHATEALAVEQYWADVDGTTFPPGFDHETVGIVWGQGASHATWWTANVEEIHGINVLPVTGGSLHAGRRPEEILRNRSALLAENGGEATVWQDVLWSQLALADPDAALALLDATPGYVPEAGESRAHTRHWIATLARLGTLADVAADSPSAAVFERDGTRTYVAFNPGDEPRTVHFGDGATLEVPARSLGSTAGPWTTPSAPPP